VWRELNVRLKYMYRNFASGCKLRVQLAVGEMASCNVSPTGPPRRAASKMPEAVIGQGANELNEQGRRNRGNAKGSGAISSPASGPGRAG
jgi:hypothetical protein